MASICVLSPIEASLEPHPLSLASLFMCLHAAAFGFDEWQRKIKQEHTLVEGLRANCEGARTGIYYQALPKFTPDLLPASKILAKSLPWSPGQPLPKGQQASA